MISNRFLPFNFAGLNSSLSAWGKASAVILPVPYDLTTSYISGTRRGPLAIIEASTHLELFDEDTEKEIASIGIHTLEQIEPVTSSPEGMINKIEQAVDKVIESDKFPVILGGEHSITLGAVKAFKKKFDDFAVVQFDAHADLRDSFQMSKFNHACIARRIHEICSIFQVGVRSFSKEEYDFLKSSKINTFFARMITGKTDWINTLVNDLPQNIYITIDLDVLDPSIMPSVGTPEPGGMDWFDILLPLQALAENRNILGFDIVELSPQPPNIAPDFLAAKLCYKLLGYIFFKNCDSYQGDID